MGANLSPAPLPLVSISAPADTTAAGIPSLPRGNRGALILLALAAGPLLMLWHLHGAWNPDGAYSYGWVVPLLAAFLIKSRWDDRPWPSAPPKEMAVVAVVLALATLPTRWLHEAAPERTFSVWIYAVSCVGISLSLIWMAGGTAWLQWFAYPFAFLLTVVPWPRSVETLISDSLMKGTAWATVEILCLAGIPSIQSGNLVHIETGVIDIDEACSGLRSLQAMVMVSIFLGELFRLRLGARVALSVIALIITVFANILRTVSLSSIGFSQGMTSVDHFHDTAGIVVLILALLCTLLVAFLLRPEKLPAEVPEIFITSLKLPVVLSAVLVGWFIFEEVAVEGWYRWRETKWQGWSWSVAWPKEASGFRLEPIAPRSLRLLMCDSAQAGMWKGPGGVEWAMYWIRWNPGNTQAEVAKVHRPDVCLNAEGAVMEKDNGQRMFTVGSLRIPFHSYTFRLGDRLIYVFFCLSEERPGQTATTTAEPQFEGVDMLDRALKGQRHIAEQSLEIAISGCKSGAEAQKAFESRIQELMKVESPRKTVEPPSDLD